jgi:hypothetical protein
MHTKHCIRENRPAAYCETQCLHLHYIPGIDNILCKPPAGGPGIQTNNPRTKNWDFIIIRKHDDDLQLYSPGWTLASLTTALHY